MSGTRNIQIVTILLATIFYSCANPHNSVVINGKIIGAIPGKVEYTVPVNGICDWMVSDSVNPDSTGNFQIKMISDKPAFIKIRASLKTQGFVIIEPGKHYDVTFDLNKNKDNFRVSGENEIAQNKYNELFYPEHIQLGARIYLKDSVASSVKEKIFKQKTEEIAIFKELFNSGKISGEFLDLVETDRSCYYSAVSATTVWIKQLMSQRNSSQPFTDEMKALWIETFKEPLLEREYIIRSPWFYSYAESYIYFMEYSNDDMNQDKMEEITKANSYKTYWVNEAKKYLKKNILEGYTAIYLYFESFQRNYEKELITLFDQFKNDFPISNYSKYLSAPIGEIIRFHQIAGSDFSENIKFIDDFRKIGKLNEVVKSLNGKRVYIDVWATWCGPCKAEFSYNDDLRKLVKSKGIDIIYISLDRDTKDEQWKEMIKFYNLEGYHVRANVDLDNDLRRIFNRNGSISIPWYLLMDEKGNILIEHAKSPSEIKELEKEINELIVAVSK